MANDNDILIGPGRLYYAPLTTAVPDETTVAFGAAWGGAWVDLGDFIEGNPPELGLTDSDTKVYTELSTAPKNAVRTQREMTITCTLAHHSPENLALLLQGTQTDTPAGSAQKAYSEITFGSQSDINFYEWGIETFRKDAADAKQPVRWFLHKGYIKPSGGIKYSKKDPTGVQIEITVLADGSQSAGEEMGILQIVTGATTTS